MNKQQIEDEIIQQEAGEQSKAQLTDQQLDSVVGGAKNTGAKLYESVSTGKHFKKANVDF
jgi:hypothetical protein